MVQHKGMTERPHEAESGAGGSPRVCVCVITYRRPEGLQRLVRSLGRLNCHDGGARIKLIVVDNDAAGSAAPICAGLRAEVDFPIAYEIEPRRGIPRARNRSVALVDSHAEFAVFVDDDETVEPDWLAQLLRVRQMYQADVVCGPVLPRFLAEPPRWMVRGRFFQLTRHPTGARVDRAYTNNTLVRTAVFRALGALFDEEMGFTGGSDTHFFRRVHQAGFKLVWADEAVVYDWIPASRMTTHWILQRAYRYGVMTPVIERDVRPGLVTSARLLLIGCYRVLKGILFLPLSWPLGRHLSVLYLRHIYYGAGMLGGLFGIRYQEYRRAHGT